MRVEVVISGSGRSLASPGRSAAANGSPGIGCGCAVKQKRIKIGRPSGMRSILEL